MRLGIYGRFKGKPLFPESDIEFVFLGARWGLVSGRWWVLDWKGVLKRVCLALLLLLAYIIVSCYLLGAAIGLPLVVIQGELAACSSSLFPLPCSLFLVLPSFLRFLYPISFAALWA